MVDRMQQESDSRPAVISYHSPAHALPARRYWITLIFFLFIFGGNIRPRLTPPGWPDEGDYALMIAVPVGAILIAKFSDLPAWALGLYGEVSAICFLLGQFADRRFPLGLAKDVRPVVINWCVAIAISWLLCRSCIIFRRRKANECQEL